ncbi:MAG: PTS sugar transporter subunit IIA [Pseudomonadota bacterium]
MSNHLHFDSVLCDINASSLKQTYQILADHISQLIGTPKQSIFLHLMTAEKEENSFIGNGIAIPHMRLERLTKPMIVLAKLNNPIESAEQDMQPVDLVCLVLSPDYEGPKHLQRLAIVSRYFKDEQFVEHLRQCKTADDIRNVLQVTNNQRLAA